MFAIVAPAVAFGGQSPRTASSKVLTRNQSLDNNTLIRRSATSVIARSTAANARNSRKTVTARPAVVRNASNVFARSGARVASAGSNLSRSAVSKNGTARSAIINKKASTSNVSRATVSRATAVFDDVTKIGGGYANCRDAYATCMDQFCAVANDTYRRCFCSDKFSTLRETSDNIDQALNVLVSFQNENLEAVNKTAAEVSAMYSSTAGERAIRKDTSASQKMLNEIGDILSGKKSKKKNDYSVSTGILDFGDLSDVGDIWSSGGYSTAFSSRTSDNMSGLEGYELYKRAGTQCAALMGDVCSKDSTFNLAASAYSVMVTQDCNILEKSINAKKENVVKTVKQAEQLLRQARLEEYRAHNSQDVNDCLVQVELALLTPVACGTNYEKCLDYTGLYIDGNTGKPISHQLFNLTTIAPDLGGEGDIIEANPRWDAFLEGKKMFATNALDTCRSLADVVWTEYKRSAMIRIAQMQDAKIEEFKDSCVQTIKECYNTNDETLNLTSDTITNDMYDVSAGRAVTVRDMCYQDVMACAAMYGGSDGCEYDKKTRKITTKRNGHCGLNSLLAYVDTVDSARVAQGCETVLVAKAHNMCDPVSTSSSTSRAAKLGRMVISHKDGNGSVISQDSASTLASANASNTASSSSTTEKYPAGCKSWSLQTIYNEIYYHANEFCAVDLAKNNRANTNFDDTTLNMQIIGDAIFNVFFRLCKDLGYSNETCEKYRKSRPQTTVSEATTSASTSSSVSSGSGKSGHKDYFQQANEKYQEDVIYSQEAGIKVGGFGSPQADMAIEDTATVAEKMQMYLAQGGDIRSQIANVVDDYSQGMNENRYDMLDQNATTMGIQQGVASQMSFAEGPVSQISVADGPNSTYNAGGVALGDTVHNSNSSYNSYNNYNNAQQAGNGAAMMTGY